MVVFSPGVSAEIHKAAELIRSAKNTVVLTGAGSSTPSGIPDFRSAGSGLWSRYLPMEVASLTSFRHNPERFFEWLRPLASHLVGAAPNSAHIALAKLENAGFVDAIITQNIDLLHHKAGSKNILQVHGSLRTLSCTGCFQSLDSDGYLEAYIETGAIPYCPDCGSILKPDVVLFEEQLPVRTWLKARQACEKCELMLVAGTSLVVMPVSDLPMLAFSRGARLIIINKSATHIDEHADVVIEGDVADMIPAIANEVLDG